MIFEKYLIMAFMLCACLSLSISAVGENVEGKKNSFIENTKKMDLMIKDTHQKRVKRYVIPLEYFMRTKKGDEINYKRQIEKALKIVETMTGDKKFIRGDDVKVFSIAEPNQQNQITVVVTDDLYVANPDPVNVPKELLHEYIPK